ncbi:MAG: succinate dehydrogenase assembly factor 2 [Betaproteobacteria bacterium AqS2]|uniref:FAD assembly factor SdhE n=1 Tax=Candidatus Amphirhobacter heronislandensis TaxID=1732024 RepID=A0A930UBM0_9GAMM|nr:succinate dehydrogenase assembly factor 2 [Betaproteobacteria bacterium AqS2]
MSSEAGLDADALRRRLAWGCRRGMLELDVLLRPLAARLDELDAAGLEAAAGLLECGDDELWDVLVLRRRAPAPAQQELVRSLLAAGPQATQGASHA